MRLVFISDTHNRHDQIPLPDGDVLIHCGDCSAAGSALEITDFLRWFKEQPHKEKLLIAGNHDWLYQKSPGYAEQLLERFGPIRYLHDSGCVINGVRFWGAPWSPEFGGWAFNLPREGPELDERWGFIPEGTEVLITHCPPKGILDTITPAGMWLGCGRLAARIQKLPKLKIHAFGHIHGGAGQRQIGEVLFINASQVNEAYQVAHQPHVIDL